MVSGSFILTGITSSKILALVVAIRGESRCYNKESKDSVSSPAGKLAGFLFVRLEQVQARFRGKIILNARNCFWRINFSPVPDRELKPE
jgi:hypothetical protein